MSAKEGLYITIKDIAENLKKAVDHIETEEFDVNDITCLVGKNEAGKTALLECTISFESHNRFGWGV